MSLWTVNNPFLPAFAACVWIVFLIVRTLWRRRLARKRLVYAALSVINDWRNRKDETYTAKYFPARVHTTTVMSELIEATKHVN